MKLDHARLRHACFQTARTVMFARRPVAVDAIQALADRFYSDALFHEEFVSGQGRDPNLITAAVSHLCHRHAIPPMEDDPRWFGDMLHVLIELCCPNQATLPEEEDFFAELTAGIEQARADIAG